MSNHVLRWALSTAAGAVVALGVADVAAAQLPPPPIPLDSFAPPELVDCTPADSTAFGITVVDNDDGTAFVQIGYFDAENACNASVEVTSFRTDETDNIREPIDEWSTDVDALEAAALGDGWLETTLNLDTCFSTIVVTLDGDELEAESFGDGCEITVTKEFPDDSWPAAISLRHGRDWTPDRILEVVDDDVAVWTGLPNGPYVVDEFDGAVSSTTISVDGDHPVAFDGTPVEVDVGESVLFTNPEPVPGQDPDPDPGPDPDPDGDPVPDPEGDPDRRPLPATGSSATVALGAIGVLSGLSGLCLVAAARRRRR